MSNKLNSLDAIALVKRSELTFLGYETEQATLLDSELSALLEQAQKHPRPIYAGIPVLSGASKNLETVRPQLNALCFGETHVTEASADMGQTEKITFTILSQEEAQEKLRLKCIPHRSLKCPRCDSVMHLYYKRITSDGYCGIEYANHVCTDITCRLNIERFYEGYGTLFY